MTPERRSPTVELLLTHGILSVGALVGFLWLRRRAARPWLPRALLVMAPLILIVSCDRVVNVIRPPSLPRDGIFVRHHARGWRHLPGTFTANWVPTYIDRYGLRVAEADWQREFKPGPRILFLGDSVTFGFLVPAEECFVSVVSEQLAQREETPAWNVLNAGVMGYDPGQEFHLLSQRFDKLRPDLVVLQFCLNDITRQFEAGRSDNALRHGELTQLYRDPHPSALIRLAREWGRRRAFGEDLHAAAAKIEHYEITELLKLPVSDEMNALWVRMLDNADEIVRFCRRKELPLGVLVFPVQDQVRNPATSLHPLRRLRAFADQNRLPCLDMMAVFESHQPRGPEAAESLFIDTTHPTVLGHAIAGRRIAGFLNETGLLDRGRDRWEDNGLD